MSVTANLTTNIPVPSGSSLVSAVYHITTTPFIKCFNQPIETSMVLCANDMSKLSFVFAKETQSRFECTEGGTFESDAETGLKNGKIQVNSFSYWAVVTFIKDWWMGKGIVYCGSVYYDDSGFPENRIIRFIITKDLPLASTVRTETSSFKCCRHRFDSQCLIAYTTISYRH